MKEFTSSWKIFRAFCIVQLILVAFQGIYSFSHLFFGENKLIHCIELVVYALVFIFVFQGLFMLNYNYPDIPLSQKQKRSFNILYLINFILIAYLFAQVLNNWWIAPYLFKPNIIKNYWYIMVGQLLSPWLIFIIHLIFLVGMYKLRRVIHQNTISSWYNQFEQKS